MVKKITREKLENIIFDHPGKDFGIRELSRLANISHPTVMQMMKCLDIVEKTANGRYRAKVDDNYKIKRKLNILQRLYQSGVVEFLTEGCLPSAIILFGSAAHGEDTEESDIDLFVEAPEKELRLTKYEKQLKRKINITFGRIKNIDKNFLNSVINGIILWGGVEL